MYTSLRILRKFYRHYKQLYATARWGLAVSKKGGEVDLTAEVIGDKNAYKKITFGKKLVLQREVSIFISPDHPDACVNFGDESYVGRNTNIAAYAPVTIGKKVLISPYCHINSCNHGFSNVDVTIYDQELTTSPINIGDGAWIGTHVIILSGTEIGEGSIVGAGSVVTKNIPPYEIWGGVPARFIKSRK